MGRSLLDTAVAVAEQAGGCEDLIALALADLAVIHEASGDVVEARRMVLRAMNLAKEADLPHLWPARWSSILRYARRLELDV